MKRHTSTNFDMQCITVATATYKTLGETQSLTDLLCLVAFALIGKLLCYTVSD